MSQTDVNALLSQMRTMAAQAENGISSVQPTQKPDENEFAELMKNAVEKVDGLQDTASAKATAFEQGASDVNLSEVMVAVQKADLSFRAMTEVRNKLVSAYQEIMNMPI